MAKTAPKVKAAASVTKTKAEKPAGSKGTKEAPKPAKKATPKAAAKPAAKTAAAAAGPAAKTAKAASKTTKAKKAKVAKGEKLYCEACGLVVSIDETCGCVEACDIICCGQNMQPRK
jgi:3-oxoacyl-ACP reductase-like protein